jgi:hypothetical protein
MVRFRACGLGEVEVSAPILLDGAQRVRPSRLVEQFGRVQGAQNVLGKGWTIMGDRSPRSGFPTPETFAKRHYVTVTM